MFHKASGLLDSLSEEELASLIQLCRSGSHHGIPIAHGDRLHELGLAELTCGGLGPTSKGRQAVRCLQTRSLAAE